MKQFIRFLSSTKLRMFMVFVINVAIAFLATYYDYAWIYFTTCIVVAFFSIFFLANRRERDAYKVVVFLTILMLPLCGIVYGEALKEKRGSSRVKKEWAKIIYRNRKSIYQNNEAMQSLKAINQDAYKTCTYIGATSGMTCHQNASLKYYSFGEAYFKDLFDECRNATKFILLELYKIVPGKVWQELFDILRLKAREGVVVKVLYDDAICTKHISNEDFLKMHNHGIETVPFNKVKAINDSFVNCRNYKKICIVDGRVGFFGGFNIDDEYIDAIELTNATKDCGLRLMGDSVKNLTVMFFEDYQFATKKVINIQEYFAESPKLKTKDWAMPYSINPVAFEHINKNILLDLINNANESISITTSYVALDDELRNALIVCAKSGIKVRLIFSSEKATSRVKTLSRSFFSELIKEGIEVYEYRGGKMTTRLIMIDNISALISTNNLDCGSTFRHFSAGVFVYGDSVMVMYNDIREIINNSQILTIKDLQKRKVGEKLSATISKFNALFK